METQADSEGAATEARRIRWFAALGLFLLWVAALGALAAVSARRPAGARHDPHETRAAR